jgi:hypothetical protein
MDPIFTFLQGAAIIGTGWVGYRCGDQLKTLINHPTIKPYKDRIRFNPAGFFNEDNCCRIVGALSGMAIARTFWYIALPLTGAYIEREHGKEIRAFLKGFQKK